MSNRAAAQAPASRFVFDSPRLGIGCFRCPPSYPHWTGVNVNRGAPIIVFPRVPVRIAYGRHAAVVADPARVMLYNSGEQYTRGVLCERGDECEWFAVAPHLLHEALSEFDPRLGDDPERPFRVKHGRGDAGAYLVQRRIFNAIRSDPAVDALWVEESFFAVLRRVLAGVYARHSAPQTERAATRRARDEAAETIRAALARDIARSWSLGDVAALVSLSAFHVCRVFRSRTGLSIHAYLNRLRLCYALERLERPGLCLTQLALDSGYSSHAHFSSAFRAALGVSPSAVRRGGSALRRARQTSTILKA